MASKMIDGKDLHVWASSLGKQKLSNKSSTTNSYHKSNWQSSMLSMENLTDDLVKETMMQLEQALQESKQLLSQRDNEIATLREELKGRQFAVPVTNAQEDLLRQLENANKRVMALEIETRQLRNLATDELEEEKVTNVDLESEGSDTKGYPSCTCYCGTLCGALREATMYKKKLETTEHKYAMLKQRIRDRRRAMEAAARGNVKMGVNDKSACVVQ